MRSVLLILLSTLISASAIAATPGLDVNDVSMLFPLRPSTFKPYPEINVGQNALGGQPLLTQKIFDKIFNQASAVLPTLGSRNLKDWRIYAFRYDPCAPGIAASMGAFAHYGVTKCVQQIRLIAQSSSPDIDVFNGKTIPGKGTTDASLHLVFQVGAGTPRPDDSAIQELLKLKRLSLAVTGVSTSGQPLRAHPGLQHELEHGTTNALAIAIRNFVLTRVSLKNLVRVTFSGAVDPNLDIHGVDSGEGASWVFVGGDISVSQAGESIWTPSANPSAPGNPVQMFNLFGPHGTVVTPRPSDAILSSTPILEKVNFDGDGAMQPLRLTSAEKSQVHSLSNPMVSHTKNRDCLSCHNATQLTVLSSASPADPARFKTPMGITGYPSVATLSRDNWSIRAFGYLDTDPSISIGVVNESARVADFINQKILHYANPGPNCSTTDAAVWQCFVHPTEVPDGHGGKRMPMDQECLASCR